LSSARPSFPQKHQSFFAQKSLKNEESFSNSTYRVFVTYCYRVFYVVWHKTCFLLSETQSENPNKNINNQKHTKMKTFKTIFAAVLFLSATTGLMAQTTLNDDIKATAEVLSVVTVEGVSELMFGDVNPGEAKTVLASDQNAGLFKLFTNTEIQITFNLPAALNGVSGQALAASATLPISFGDGTALLKTADGNNTHAFNPALAIDINYATENTRPFLMSEEDFELYIGGTVTPSTGQIAGGYEGTITVSAVYN
jgi:hypothetical protein